MRENRNPVMSINSSSLKTRGSVSRWGRLVYDTGRQEMEEHKFSILLMTQNEG
jgi:hypothetical protein